MKLLKILVGPPGSGKSTLSQIYSDYVRISQDDQGKLGHWEVFTGALTQGKDIIVDRMNFDVRQRAKFIEPAKAAGYEIQIEVLHESRQTCLDRMHKRERHPTIKDAASAVSALNTFFSKYERPTLAEASQVYYRYPDHSRESAVVCDLDGTLCNIDHRLHHVRGDGKKDWRSFFQGLEWDTINPWCEEILEAMGNKHRLVFASGRPDNYHQETANWLSRHEFSPLYLYMRNRHDQRQDYIVKEIILDFEILTRFTPLFFIDDRKQVVDMWRRRGYTVLHCAEGDF